MWPRGSRVSVQPSASGRVRNIPAQVDIQTVPRSSTTWRPRTRTSGSHETESGSGNWTRPRKVATHRLPSRSTIIAPPLGRPSELVIVSRGSPGASRTRAES